MDIKVYKKEEVIQPSGTEYVYKPDIIDLIPTIINAESSRSIKNGKWTLEQLKKVADVEIVDNKLIINSDKVHFVDGDLLVTLTEDQIISVDILEDGSRELLEQQCALATIFQKGLDPLDSEDGIRWSETILGEVSVVELMEDITQAVANVTSTVSVEFDTVEDAKGNSYLTYKLREVA